MSDNPADAAGIFPSWGCAGMLWLASFTAAGAALIGFAAVWLPELIPATAIGCIAWWVWHTFRISGAGTVLTVGAMLSATMIASVSYRSHGSMFDVIPITFSVFVGVPFLLAGVIIFLVRAFADRKRWFQGRTPSRAAFKRSQARLTLFENGVENAATSLWKS